MLPRYPPRVSLPSHLLVAILLQTKRQIDIRNIGFQSGLKCCLLSADCCIFNDLDVFTPWGRS
jgi:hypothetical protein